MNRRVSHQSESHLRLGMSSSFTLPQPGTVVQRVISSVQKQDNMGDKWHLGEASCHFVYYGSARDYYIASPSRNTSEARFNSNPPLQRGDDLGTGLGASPWRIFPSRPFWHSLIIATLLTATYAIKHPLLPHPSLIPKHLLNKMD